MSDKFQKARELRAQGYNWSEVARVTGIPRNTLKLNLDREYNVRYNAARREAVSLDAHIFQPVANWMGAWRDKSWVSATPFHAE